MVRHFRYRDFQFRAVNTVIALRDDDQRCAREIDRCSNYLDEFVQLHPRQVTPTAPGAALSHQISKSF